TCALPISLLVGQILSEGFAPVCAFCCISEVFFGRTNRFTISGDQFGIRQVVLLSVSIFNVTNCTRQTLNERSDTVVTFTTQTDRPFYGRASTNVVFPLFIHFRQVAGEDEGSPGAICAAYYSNVL